MSSGVDACASNGNDTVPGQAARARSGRLWAQPTYSLVIGARVGDVSTSWRCFVLRAGRRRMEEFSIVKLTGLS